MINNKKGADIAKKLFSKVLNLPTHSLCQSIGSFITFNWGEKQKINFKTKEGNIDSYIKGEWYLWTQMCAWEILTYRYKKGAEDDEESIVLAHSESSRKKLQLY